MSRWQLGIPALALVSGLASFEVPELAFVVQAWGLGAAAGAMVAYRNRKLGRTGPSTEDLVVRFGAAGVVVGVVLQVAVGVTS